MVFPTVAPGLSFHSSANIAHSWILISRLKPELPVKWAMVSCSENRFTHGLRFGFLIPLGWGLALPGIPTLVASRQPIAALSIDPGLA